ncbi:hypothetical protein [Actinoplanes sp. GCM10030250]|uniref:hypothetical protein n=1 Tax=Actinoplanes sp. GCM10030250 TaxID=3273376 RepID=UPI0036235161
MRSVLALVVIGTLLSPSPAHAAVKFDRATMTGFVDRADVQKAFGWDDATLKARAAAVRFAVTNDTFDEYTVVCRRGRAGSDRTFPFTHHSIFGASNLKSAVVDGRKGYTREITGFQLDGAVSGLSGATVMPPVGEHCPDDKAPEDEVLVSLRLLSSADREALTVSHDDETHELIVIGS